MSKTAETVVDKQASESAFEAYENGRVIILESNISWFVFFMLTFAFLITAVSIGVWASDKYSSHTTEKSHDNIIYVNYAVSGIALAGVIALIIWWFELLGRRNKNWNDGKLEQEAAKLFAHAYGEKAKSVATQSSKQKASDFKQAMYRHLYSAFYQPTVVNADINNPDQAAQNISDAFMGSVKEGQNQKAAASTLTPLVMEKTPATLTPTTKEEIKRQNTYPSTVNYAPRRRKSPSSLKKKKKASPTKKKVASSKRK